jgi:hypothetical protein
MARKSLVHCLALEGPFKVEDRFWVCVTRPIRGTGAWIT